MRSAAIRGILAMVALFAVSGTASALNCEQARRYAATGRKAEDIADTMVADVNEVKKCLEGGAKDGGEKKEAPAPSPGAKSQ
jgi:hypothetical protein